MRHQDLLIASAYVVPLRENGLDSLDGLFAAGTAAAAGGATNFERRAESLIKPGLETWRQRLRLTINVGGRSEVLYLKRYLNPPAGARRAVRRARCGAGSTAGVEWAWLNRLHDEGIPCPAAVAFGDELVGRREHRSAVLLTAVPGMSLETWAKQWKDEDGATVRALIPAVAGLIGRLHGRGYIHRDLYLSHVFYDPSTCQARKVAAETQPAACDPATRSGLHLIDLQRVCRPRWRLRQWVVKDLAALNYSTPGGMVSRSDRLRWLKLYLGLSKLNPSARRLVCRVEGKTRRIARHDLRRQQGVLAAEIRRR